MSNYLGAQGRSMNRVKSLYGRRPMTGMKILCVENQPQDMAVLTYMLQGIGFEVMPASSGQQAIDMVAKEAIDGILLEYNLPDGGTAVRTRLKAMRPDLPVLLFSGVSSQTPFMLRFFEAYLRNGDRIGEGWEDPDF
jgi:CheY-like chemotaxis protein